MVPVMGSENVWKIHFHLIWNPDPRFLGVVGCYGMWDPGSIPSTEIPICAPSGGERWLKMLLTSDCILR